MTNAVRYSISAILAAGICCGMLFLNRYNRQEHTRLTCTGLDICFSDSLEFVSGQDVRDYLSEKYGSCIGQRLDSVKLSLIEDLLEKRSAILDCEAWTTEDGTLHICVSQRAPVARFQGNGTGFYVDDRAYIFPLHKTYTAPVPVIEGAIPVQVTEGYKGEPESGEELLWIRETIDLLDFISDSSFWNDKITAIRVLDNGDMLLSTTEGEETFLFGEPRSISDKFKRMETYYSHIRAEKGNIYNYVNVKYNGQIICMTKDI